MTTLPRSDDQSRVWLFQSTQNENDFSQCISYYVSFKLFSFINWLSNEMEINHIQLQLLTFVSIFLLDVCSKEKIRFFLCFIQEECVLWCDCGINSKWKPSALIDVHFDCDKSILKNPEWFIYRCVMRVLFGRAIFVFSGIRGMSLYTLLK